jgi:hypothetical protein
MGFCCGGGWCSWKDVSCSNVSAAIASSSSGWCFVFDQV